jgi:hypothetical protein
LEETSLALSRGQLFPDLVPARIAAGGWLCSGGSIQKVGATDLSVQIEKKHQLFAMVDLLILPDAEDTGEQLTAPHFQKRREPKYEQAIRFTYCS